MTDNSDESMLRERKGKEEKLTDNVHSDKESSKIEKAEPQIQTTWQKAKYYFNRFRYYHFLVADTIDLYASAACLWLINMYLKLFMGVGPDVPSALVEDDS